MRNLLLLFAYLWAIPALAQSTQQGNTFIGALATSAKPTPSTGAEGSYFLDANTFAIWGPKSSGSWGSAAAYTLPGGSATSIDAAGATSITNGTLDDFLYDNSGKVGVFNLFSTANTWTAEQTFSANITTPYVTATNTVETAGGGYEIKITGAPTDENNSDTLTDDGGTLYFRFINDAFNANNSWLSVSRSGYTPLLATFGENINISTLAGTGSRPVCVTSAGLLEPGSLSTGLTTCP